MAATRILIYFTVAVVAAGYWPAAKGGNPDGNSTGLKRHDSRCVSESDSNDLLFEGMKGHSAVVDRPVAGALLSLIQHSPGAGDIAAGSSIAPEENNELVVDHLYQLYQAPPPFAKPWPPSSIAEWEAQRPFYVEALQRMLNLPPDRKKTEWPLNVRFTKPDRQLPDFTIKYLAYQSRTGFWVTANLYIPANVPMPAPAILMMHGHTAEGKATPYYQQLVQNLVKKGYVVFFKDGIGLGERTYTGHNFERKAPYTFVSGISLEGMETWDNIRAVDVLYSEPLSAWVDTSHIGATGMSGGSMQTFYLTVVDGRIKAAAPVCRSNTYRAEFRLWGHCICCVCATGIRRSAEEYHLLAAAAPRPVIICNGTTDKNHPLEGAKELVREAGAVYALYEQPDNLRLIVDDVGHELSLKFRTAVYELFNTNFRVNATTVEDTVMTLSQADLDCGLPVESILTLAGLVHEESRNLQRNTGVSESISDFHRYSDNLRRIIRDDVFGYAAYMPSACALNPEMVSKTESGAYVTEAIRYASEPDIPISASFVYKKDASRMPVVIMVNAQGGMVREFIERGIAVFTVQVRPNGGDLRRYGDNWGVWARGMSCGKPSTGMRVYDILRAIDYLETRAGLIDTTSIGCIGMGDPRNAMYALYAAALDDRIASVVLEQPVTTYKPPSGDLARWHEWPLDMYIPQILLHADVSQIASLIAPRPMLFVDGRDMGNQPVSVNEARSHLHSCVRAFNLFNAGDNLSIRPAVGPGEYATWFDRHLNRE